MKCDVYGYIRIPVVKSVDVDSKAEAIGQCYEDLGNTNIKGFELILHTKNEFIITGCDYEIEWESALFEDEV